MALGSFRHFVVAAMKFPEAPKCHFLVGKVKILTRPQVFRAVNSSGTSQSSLFQLENGTWELLEISSPRLRNARSSQVPFSCWKSEDSEASRKFPTRRTSRRHEMFTFPTGKVPLAQSVVFVVATTESRSCANGTFPARKVNIS